MKIKNVILLCFFSIKLASYSQEYNVQIYNSIRGLVSSGIVSIAFEDKTNKLWVSTRSDGVYSFNGKKYTKYKVKQEQKGVFSSHVIKDSKGKIWYINYSMPHIYFATLSDFKQNKIDTIINNDCDFFKTKKIEVIYIKNEPCILHHCVNFIFIYNLKTKKSEKININQIVKYLVYHDDAIYFSSENGIYSIGKENEIKPHILYSNIESFIFNQNKIWAFSKGKLLLFENQRLKKELIVTQTTDYDQLKIASIDGAIYIYSNNFTYRYENEELKPLMEKNGLLNNGSNSIVSDLENNIWICQKSGLIKLSSINLITYKGKDAHFVDNEFSVIKTINSNKKLVGGGYLFSIVDNQFNVLETVNFKIKNYLR